MCKVILWSDFLKTVKTASIFTWTSQSLKHVHVNGWLFTLLFRQTCPKRNRMCLWWRDSNLCEVSSVVFPAEEESRSGSFVSVLLYLMLFDTETWRTACENCLLRARLKRLGWLNMTYKHTTTTTYGLSEFFKPIFMTVKYIYTLMLINIAFIIEYYEMICCV